MSYDIIEGDENVFPLYYKPVNLGKHNHKQQKS